MLGFISEIREFIKKRRQAVQDAEHNRLHEATFHTRVHENVLVYIRPEQKASDIGNLLFLCAATVEVIYETSKYKSYPHNYVLNLRNIQDLQMELLQSWKDKVTNFRENNNVLDPSGHFMKVHLVKKNPSESLQNQICASFHNTALIEWQEEECTKLKITAMSAWKNII